MAGILSEGNRDPALRSKFTSLHLTLSTLRDASLSLRAVFSLVASGARAGWGSVVRSTVLSAVPFVFAQVATRISLIILFGDGQVKREGRSFSFPTLNPETSLMPLNDLPRNIEADTQPWIRFLDRKSVV